jgi:hypothetical protein
MLSFISMCIALIVGAGIILGAMWRAKAVEVQKDRERGAAGEFYGRI